MRSASCRQRRSSNNRVARISQNLSRDVLESALFVGLLFGAKRSSHLKVPVGIVCPAHLLVGPGERIMGEIVPRIELQGSLQKSGSEFRIALLQLHLPQ